MRRIFSTYGKDVTKLDISNWNHFTYNAQELLDAINMLTNLESLEFSWHKDKFEGEPVGTLNLPKLTKVILEDNSGKDKKIVLDFLMKVLPENSLTALEIEDDENYGAFLEKQKNIKKLSYKGESGTLNPTLYPYTNCHFSIQVLIRFSATPSTTSNSTRSPASSTPPHQWTRKNSPTALNSSQPS